MAIIKIRNAAIDLDAAEIPNIDASKITTGSLGADRIPSLAASKIGSGTFADARIAASNVSQHATSFDDNKIVNDISTIALRQASNENKGAYNTNSMYVDVFQDSTGITSLTNTNRNSDGEYISSVSGTAVPTNAKVYVKSNSASNGSTSFTDSSSSARSLSVNGNIQHSTEHTKMTGSSSSIKGDGAGDSINWSNTSDMGAMDDFYMGLWVRSARSWTSANNKLITMGGHGSGYDYNGWSFQVNGSGKLDFHTTANNHPSASGQGWQLNVRTNNAVSLSQDTWYHLAVGRTGSTWSFWKDGQVLESGSYDYQVGNSTVQIGQGSRDGKIGNASDNSGSNGLSGYMDNIIVIKGSHPFTAGSNYTPPTEYYGTTSSATGSFESNAITAPSSTNKMGAIITYQDNAGTNTLNTDIVLQLSADNGSNFTTATMTAMPDFASGIKMAKVNDLSVTAGTQLKYKISFANQSSGSKEARIRGVSLQY